MTENQAPSTAAANATDQPGRPYYESLRTTLRGTLAKKRALDEQLATLEDNIFKLETNYLEDTSGAGNIVRGFDNWVKGVVVGNDRRGDDRKGRTRIRDEDRIFSNSSMTWLRSQESGGDTSAANTPSHAPTPTGSGPTSARMLDHSTPVTATSKAGNKKKKADRDDEDDGKPAKRSKISYGRG